MTSRTFAPPEYPWKHGKHPDYTALTVQVHLCQDKNGMVFSEHMLSPEDEALCRGLPNAGVQQIAYALLLEAARSEAFVAALVLETKEGFLERYKDASPEERTKMEHMLTNAGMSVMTQTLGKLLPAASKEVLHMLSGQDS